MKKTFGILLTFSSAAGLVLLWRRLFVRTPRSSPRPADRASRVRPFPAEPGAHSLVDLNTADDASLRNLQLQPQSVDRLIENRPYRSKLELVSRMVLTEPEYEIIRDRVTVTASQEPVKIA